MKKILVSVLLVAIVMSLGMVPASASSLTPLRIGLMPSAVGAPVQFANEKGYFDEVGVNVELVIFPNGAAINEAMAAGELDVSCSGAATVFALANGDNVLIGDVEMSGGMGIWTNPDSDIMTVQGQIEKYPEMYGSAEILKGKSFICSLGTASQFNVLRYLEQFGLTDEDVTLINMDWAAGVQAFTTGQADAIATFSPYSAQVEEAGGVKICTFEDATETALYDMVFTSRSVIESRRDDVVKFLSAFFKATEELAHDDALRSEWSIEWFASEGRTYDEETMAQEIIDRPYVTKELMGSDSYILGDAMYSYAAFNVSIGKIEEDQMDFMKTCYDASITSDALGVTVRQPQF